MRSAKLACRFLVHVLCLPILLVHLNAAPISAAPNEPEEDPGIRVGYGPKGWEFGSADGRYLMTLEWRLQFRYAYPRDTDPVTFDDFLEREHHVFKVNRARLKVGGNAYQKWLKYYMEYELASSNLLDFRVMLEKYPAAKLKIGQWKVHYNRERVISSGKQQLVDRSMINRAFTVDRQVGVSLYGKLKGSGLLDFDYWASVFTGTGRGSGMNDDSHMMWMLRGQWNFLGRTLGFLGSDIEYRKDPAGLIALAAVTNCSPYTRFSQAGGGQLEGFEEGQAGQYRVNQAMLETAFMYRGFSWQQELHWKEINDLKNETTTTLAGNYAQLGFFFHSVWEWFPRPLEVALRYAFYHPDVDIPERLSQELSLACNWFFSGHRNKLTTELTYFDFQANPEQQESGWRFRLQWDVSF